MNEKLIFRNSPINEYLLQLIDILLYRGRVKVKMYPPKLSNAARGFTIGTKAWQV